MRENYWEFDPTHKLVIATNHLPRIRGCDEGIWRRIKVVPFTVHVDADKADRGMSEKLKAEHPGILAWAVRGCLDWQRVGLTTPKSVMDATGDYRAEQDAVGAFLSERVVECKHERLKPGDLYGAYATWATENHEHIESKIAIGKAMSTRGYERDDDHHKSYKDIRLR
jgi:putative DNA primase/helicase